MATIEMRIRRVLHCYPRQWRTDHGDAVTGTLLDATDGRSPKEVRTELTGLALHGVAERLSFFTDPRARAGAATLSLATGFGYALVQAFMTGFATVGSRGVPHTGLQVATSATSAGALLAILWFVALCCSYFASNWGRVTALAAIVVVAVLAEVLQGVAPFAGAISSFALLFHATTAAVALLGQPRSRPLLTGLTAAWAGMIALVVSRSGLYWTQASPGVWSTGPLDAAGLTFALAAAALVAAALINTGHQHAAAALLLSAGPWLAVWAVEIATNPNHYFEFPFPVYSATLLALCAASLVALHRRQQHRIRARSGQDISTARAPGQR